MFYLENYSICNHKLLPQLQFLFIDRMNMYFYSILLYMPDNRSGKAYMIVCQYYNRCTNHFLLYNHMCSIRNYNNNDYKANNYDSNYRNYNFDRYKIDLYIN